MEGPDTGRWIYEISVWDLAGKEQVFQPLVLGPFDTEDQAIHAGRIAVKGACDGYSNAVAGSDSTEYIDMKNGGVARPWVEH